MAPSAAALYGFDLGVDFNQDGSGRQGQLVFHGSANNYLDTSQFGDLQLGPACPKSGASEIKPSQPSKPIQAFQGLVLAPNPSHGMTQLFWTQGQEAQAQITVYALDGSQAWPQGSPSQNLGSLAAGTHSAQLDLRGLPSGIYFAGLRLSQGSPAQLLKKFAIVR